MKVKEIPLTRGFVAIVDDDDFEYISKFKWFEDDGYAIRNIRLPNGQKCIVQMHRVILGLQRGDGIDVDHKNRIRYDNRKENLRACTRSENLRNKVAKPGSFSGLKGVSWHKQNKAWRARIKIHGKEIRLGQFKTKEDAHAAYCKAADEIHGEFANHGAK